MRGSGTGSPVSTGVVLLAAAMMASGCAARSPQRQECREVTSTPLRLGVSIVAEAEIVRGYQARRKATFALHEGGGIVLALFSPQEFLSPNESFLCRLLSQQELDVWDDTAEALASRLAPRRGEPREVISVAGPDGQHMGLGATDDLDPDALEAARAFACLVLETFGESGERAIREAGPLLSARLGFPMTCTSSTEKEQRP